MPTAMDVESQDDYTIAQEITFNDGEVSKKIMFVWDPATNDWWTETAPYFIHFDAELKKWIVSATDGECRTPPESSCSCSLAGDCCRRSAECGSMPHGATC